MENLSRRDVLAGAASVILGAGAAPGISSQPEPKPVGWAILGLGSYATRQILPNMRFCTRSKPVAFISGSPEKTRRFARQYGVAEHSIYNYENLEKIANNPEIEVVYVLTPPGTHAEFTIRSLKAGKHVVCEKPMASSSQECREMIATARQMGKRLQIGYRCHFEPHNLEAMRLCRQGAVGKIHTVRSDHGFKLDWDGGWHTDGRLGGFGAISEIGVYSIQALCYLTGEEPTAVWGTSHKSDARRFREVEDLNHFNLFFPSGAQGIGATAYSWNANNFRVLGTEGNIDAEPATGYGGHVFRRNGRPIEVAAANQWARQMDHMSECVRDPQKTLVAPGEMGLRDIEIIEAVLRSAQTGSVVSLAG
ncbi:MAG: Gfo/Idh/MocA family oxidoreductase [Fimbriimonadaceae bacterium]